MTRLTGYHRENIVRAAVAAKFDPILSALKDRSDLLANAIYREHYPLDVINLAKKMPKAWSYERSSLEANAGGWSVKVMSKKPLRVSYDEHYGRIASYEVGSELCTDLQAFATDYKQYEADRKAAFELINAQFRTITTFEKLREIWPDGKKFIDAEEPEQTQLPAVQIDKVNELLGLPT